MNRATRLEGNKDDGKILLVRFIKCYLAQLKLKKLKKNAVHRTNVLKEILQTEQGYVRNLRVIIQVRIHKYFKNKLSTDN